MPIPVWIAFVIGAAVILRVGIEWIIVRLGVERQDPASAPRGLAEWGDRYREWRQRRDR